MVSPVTGGYLTTREAAEALGLSRATLRNWAAEGRVRPAFRTRGGDRRGGDYRWDLADLKRQLAEEDTLREEPEGGTAQQ